MKWRRSPKAGRRRNECTLGYSDHSAAVLAHTWHRDVLGVKTSAKKGGGGGAMGFGKSKAKLLTERQGKVTFEDVAGIDEAREELEEIVEFLRDPQRFSKLGGQIPKGAISWWDLLEREKLCWLERRLVKPAPSTISGSDFVEMFVGVGASRVRDMFEQAKKNAPVFYSSMRSTLLVVLVVTALAIPTMKESKR